MKTLTFAAKLNIDDREVEQLCAALECDEGALGQRLNTFVAAAMREYIDMFTGAGPILSVTDVRERRLVALIRHAFLEMPRPGEVASLFSITPTAAGTLLRNAAAKHRLTVKSSVTSALRKVLAESIVAGAGLREVTVQNPLLIRLLNDMVDQAPVPKVRIDLRGDSKTRYTIEPGTYTYLNDKLNPLGPPVNG